MSANRKTFHVDRVLIDAVGRMLGGHGHAPTCDRFDPSTVRVADSEDRRMLLRTNESHQPGS
jgi:hypothetical protein